jgi:membrane protease YdiL (CAAX protease family)
MKNIYTVIGLFISYTSITVLNLIFKYFFGNQLTDLTAIARELLILGMVAVVLWIVVKKEKLPLESIGLHARNWKGTWIWALVTVVGCFALAFACILFAQIIGWKFGESKAFDKLSLFAISIIVIRAGVAEEVFMRGFIIERLTTWTGNKYAAAMLSLVPFALLHYSQGYAGILISFVLGGMLTVMYMWRRDLKANIIAHFLVDFIPNVLAPLVSGTE